MVNCNVIRDRNSYFYDATLLVDFQPSKMKFILVGPNRKGIEILIFQIFYSGLISNILFTYE